MTGHALLLAALLLGGLAFLFAVVDQAKAAVACLAVGVVLLAVAFLAV